MILLTKLYNWLRGILGRQPVRLAIVRRYADANGNYVGELYVERDFAGVRSYQMIGASLDSLALDFDGSNAVWGLDTRNDFLAPMGRGVVRVGALEPGDNDRVRAMVDRMPRHRMTLIVQNRFIEHVLEPRKV